MARTAQTQRRPRAQPEALRRDLWVGWKPNGLGEQKPNHYGDIAQRCWENRHNLPYAWRILRKGVCDGCALGVAGFHDWTISGVHLCTTRLELLKVNTDARSPDDALADVAALDEVQGRELRELGRLAHPMVRHRGDRGFRRVSWDDALDWSRPRIRHDGAEPARHLPDRARHHQRGVLRRAEGGAVHRHEQRRQRGARVSRAVDQRVEGDARRRGHDVLVPRRHRERSDRALRRRRRQRAAGVHEVPLPREEARARRSRSSTRCASPGSSATGCRRASRARCSARR